MHLTVRLILYLPQQEVEGGHHGPAQGVEPKWGKEGHPNYTELCGRNSKRMRT